MKILSLKGFLIFCLLFLFSCHNTYAQKTDLGIFSSSFWKNKLDKDLVLTVNGTKYPLSKNEMQKWVSEDIKLLQNPDYNSEIENTNFCAYKKSVACNLSWDIKNEKHIRRISSFQLDEDLVREFV
jgi:hypothetical protein